MKRHPGPPVQLREASPSFGTPGSHVTRWILCLTCFFSGALTLAIEIAGNRLLSPLFGSSLYTWTSLIGVVLVAISVGDFLGGYLVDRVPRPWLLGFLLLAAAAWTLLVPVLHGGLRDAFARSGLISGPLVISLLLFAGPACLLAAVGPFIVRLLSGTREDLQIGLSAGLAGMLATLGSFVGTLITGFYLIPQHGVRATFLVAGLLAAVLGTAVLLWCRAERTSGLAVAFVAVAGAVAANVFGSPTPPARVIHEQQTHYYDLAVEESVTDHGDPIRTLRLDTTMEGAQYVETGGIVMTCNLYWRLAEVYCPRLDRALFLGGGAFTMPQDFCRRHPEARSNVCELDPAVVEVGRRFFRLDEFPRVRPIVDDARRHLAASDMTYDFIFGDAYQGVRNIPPHLVTREFFALVRSRLSDDGIFLMNVISPVRGDHSRLFHSIYSTVQTEFPYTEAYGVNPAEPDQPQNIIVLAATRPPRVQDRPTASEDVTRLLLSTRLAEPLPQPDGVVVLTDDHNPAEWLIARQLLNHPPAPW